MTLPAFAVTSRYRADGMFGRSRPLTTRSTETGIPMFVLKARHLMAAGLVSLAAWSAGAYAGAVEQLAIAEQSLHAKGAYVP